MDPDAFWSLWSFYYILEKLWKNVKAINDEQKPENFAFLDKNQIFETNLDLKKFNPDLIISFDSASTEQLWEIYKKNEKIFKKTDFVVIDHHITNSWFWNLNIINSNSSSTCELLFSIIKEIWFLKYLEEKELNLLMAGILTDTNVFYNTNVTVNTHFTAWELLNLWANSRNSIFEFFKKKTITKTKLLWKALQNLEIIYNKINSKNIVYTILRKSDFEELNATDKETNWIIEHLINIENTELAFIIYPLDKW
jgi:phosphoesterase RecJ-like protein